MKNLIKICVLLLITSCSLSTKKDHKGIIQPVPDGIPIVFDSVRIPDGSIIHRGVFSNDLDQYYFTVSNKDFTNFNILVSNKLEGQWKEPENTFFNSKYDDHGMSFSPDGNTLVFSSTRPLPGDSIPKTWHLWVCKRNNDKWTDPQYLPIPNLEHKLLSHPTLAPDGTIYFHASNPDYSDMAIYSSAFRDGRYQAAERMKFDLNAVGYCTPYISADGKTLIFAAVGESLDLYMCVKDDENKWMIPRILNSEINKNGHGNPYLTPDAKYLFFAAENRKTSAWNIKRVDIEVFFLK